MEAVRCSHMPRVLNYVLDFTTSHHSVNSHFDGVCIISRAVIRCAVASRQGGFVRRLRESDTGDARAGAAISPFSDRWKGVAAVRRRWTPGDRLQRACLVATCCLRAVRQHGHDAF